MRRAARIGAILVVIGAILVGGFWMMRGKTGASRDFGGSLEASAVPDFPHLSAERWVNGAPLSLAAARGSVVLIEAWAPG